MLRPEPRDRPFLVALLAIAFALYLNWGLSPLPPQGGPPKAHADQEQEWNTPLSHLWDWLAKDSISLFTGVLALLTGWLVIYNGRQINLARAEFIASHRPRIRLRRAFGPSPLEDGGYGFVIVIANVGDSDAYMIALKVQAFAHGGYGAGVAAMALNENPIPFPLKISSGEAYRAVYRLKTPWMPEFAVNRVGPIICQGIITYTDDNKVARHTGFWRQTIRGEIDASEIGIDDEYED